MVLAALLSAQTGSVLAEDQNDELNRLKQQLQQLDQKVKILERNRELEGEAADAKARTVPLVTIGAGGWGAWEIAARVGQLEVDDDVFSDGDNTGGPDFATAASARKVREWGVGLNWHLNRNVKASVNYINTDFKGGSKAKGEVMAQDEDVFLARIQLSF